ncbi:MAG: single-stranded DNA-binding protein [Erysipelotrichia bacterium]|jgi:single-strand DNA-binding protein|nr:single-stranded DNA-binding protein [Erysipelotrichia bacterium]
MINRVILIGRLTKDPVLRKTPNGASVCNFSLAVSRRKSKNDTTTPDADFVPCVAWNQTAELITTYLRKGSQLGVEGKIQTRNYEDPNTPGKRVYVVEVLVDSIMFLDSKSASVDSSTSYTTDYYPDESYADVADGPKLDISSDDLPF